MVRCSRTIVWPSGCMCRGCKMSTHVPTAIPADQQQRQQRLRLAVFKFASCDGCQLQLLSCEDELLAIADRVDIVHFLEASSHVEPGPYDITLVEGSISTAADRQRIQSIRRESRYLSHDRRLCHRGRHPGIEKLGGSRRISSLCVRATGVHFDTFHIDGDFRTCESRFRACAGVRSIGINCWK